MKLRNKRVAPFALACLLCISGCNGTSKDGGDAPEVSIGQVRFALDQKNFGEAAVLSDRLTAANPRNADAWLAAADAKAASGSRLAALAALENAINNGMRDAGRLDTDSYLDTLRSSDEYQALLVRSGLVESIARAGDTSINETSTGTVVRAGDVSVTFPNTK